MQTTDIIVRPLQGMQTNLPQPVEAATEIVNMTVDPETGGWSSRVGYEPYRANPAVGFAPFGSLGRIDSLHVSQLLPNGGREVILLESGGNLYLLHDYGKPTSNLVGLIASRSIPASNQPASYYCDTPHGIVVTNGEDYPMLIQPWPLGNASYTAAKSVIYSRPLGFPSVPSSPDCGQVITPSGIQSGDTQNEHAITYWWPTKAYAIGQYGDWGLGFSRNTAAYEDKQSLYKYAVSFISDTGSESPLSDTGSVSWELKASAEGWQYGVKVIMPRGPAGTIGRRIYRTGNHSFDTDNPDPTLAHLIDIRNNSEEVFYDIISSRSRGAEAPSAVESSVFPAPRARFSAMYQGCLFLDGGPTDPYTVFYSHPSKIDQYRADAYIRLGGEGGAITGIFGSYTSLLILRERGVDVITGDFYQGFSATTISREVSCTSPHTVDFVPGLGTVFVAKEGIFALTGGLVGGAQVGLENLTVGLSKYVDRFSVDTLPRAVGRYTPLTREYHVYIPVDGSDRPTLGMVYHLDKGWSLRENFPVGALDRLATGELLFGHHTGNEFTSPNSGDNPESGLFVITPVRAMGGEIDNDVFVPSAATLSRYKSAWHDYNDPQLQKRIQYVTLWAVTSGSHTVSVNVYKDFGYRIVSTSREYKLQPPDAALLPVYGPTALSSRETATWDTSEWQEVMTVPIRIETAHQSCSQFAFEVTTTDDIVIVGYTLHTTSGGTRTIRGHR